LQDYLLLALGVACAAYGGDLFVRGAIGLAHAARVSGAIIGSTVAAFATSSPEFAVAVTSALQETPQLSFGNALGSNVVNIALILGLTLLVAPMVVPHGNTRRDFPIAIAAPVLTALACRDGLLSRLEALLLIALFVIWLARTISSARQTRTVISEVQHMVRGHHAAALGGAGLLLLIAAGELIVGGAQGIAKAFGITDFIIGATIVAIGTTVPELSTALIAKWRGHDEIGLGTLLGSTIFNSLWIVPFAALLHPIQVEWQQASSALAFCVLCLLLAIPFQSQTIGRGRGAALLLVYVVYVATVFQS